MTRELTLSIVLTVFLLEACSRCEEKDDEELILQLIDNGARAAEEHRIGDVIGVTTQDFSTQPGQLDRRATKGVLLMAVRRYKRFKVHYPPPTIQIIQSGLAAETSFPFVIVREGQKVPELSGLADNPKEWLNKVAKLADLYYMKLWFIKEDAAWKVKKAEVNGYREIDEL